MRGALPPGRPDAEMVRWRARCAQLFKQVVTDRDVIEIIETAVERAKLNDAEARSWLSAYIFPKPTRDDDSRSAIDVDGNLNVVIQTLNTDELRQAAEALSAIDAAVTQRSSQPHPVALADPSRP